MIRVPLTRQSTNYTCGVAALQSLLGYYDIKIREDLLAKEVKCGPSGGTPNWEIVRYLKENGFEAETTLDTDFSKIQNEIDNERPVLVAIQAWKGRDDNRAWSEVWDCGHYIVVIGYDEEKIYFMDPSTLGNYTYIEQEEFFNRWHDIDQNKKTVNRLAIFVKSIINREFYQPDQITKIE